MKSSSDLSKLKTCQLDLAQNFIPELDSVMALDQQMEDELWSQQNWNNIVLNSGRNFELWISALPSQSEIRAFCLIEVIGKNDFAHLHKIVTDHGRRGQGLASTLLDKVLERMRELGCPRVILEVATNNEKAIALYRSRQFSQIHKVAKFYQSGKDAFIMELSL